jgi:hypothetical protein
MYVLLNSGSVDRSTSSASRQRPPPGGYGAADFAHTAMSELFAAPRPRQVADRSVGKLVGFLVAPHQAVTRTSSASHCTVQFVASQADRTSRTPVAEPAGPERPGGPGGPGSPFGPCGPCPHAPKARATTHINATSRILIMLSIAPQSGLVSRAGLSNWAAHRHRQSRSRCIPCADQMRAQARCRAKHQRSIPRRDGTTNSKPRASGRPAPSCWRGSSVSVVPASEASAALCLSAAVTVKHVEVMVGP